MLPSVFEYMFVQTSDVHSYSTTQADLSMFSMILRKEHKVLVLLSISPLSMSKIIIISIVIIVVINYYHHH